MKKTQETSLIMPVTTEFIERRILLIRGQKVMLDSDLAELYQVETKALNRAVLRNAERFPEDFMLELSKEESNLKYQIGTSSWGGRRKLSHAFTELGVAMLSSVLRSDRAVQMNLYIMRAFVKLRELLATHKDLAKKIGELESGQKEYQEHLIVISAAIKELMNDTKKLKEAHKPLKSAIGFQVNR